MAEIAEGLNRPWCCPEPDRCAPVHQLGYPGPTGTRGDSFLCFGEMTEPVEFLYDGAPHVNDLRSCRYTPLKGVVANQENADDWRAFANAYTRALGALGGWGVPSIEQRPVEERIRPSQLSGAPEGGTDG